jgi:hypothetical protein
VIRCSFAGWCIRVSPLLAPVNGGSFVIRVSPCSSVALIRVLPWPGWRPVRFRLACGTRSRRLINDHHRTTERYTPQPPRVSLAKLRGFLEITFGELWFDLRLGSRRSAQQREQENPVEIVSSPASTSPVAKFSVVSSPAQRTISPATDRPARNHRST